METGKGNTYGELCIFLLMLSIEFSAAAVAVNYPLLAWWAYSNL